MSVVRSPVRSVVRSPVRGVFGAGDTQTDLQRILALSPSLLIWPANGAGWQGTSGGTLAASGQPVGVLPDLAAFGGKTQAEWLAAPNTTNLASGILNSTSGWTFVSDVTVSGGAIVFTSPPSTTVTATYNPIVANNKPHVITFTLTGTGNMTVRTGSGGDTSGLLSAPGTYQLVMRAAGGTPTQLTFSSHNSAVSNFVGSVTGLTVYELVGNPSRAGTWASPSDAARGTFQNNAINFDGSSDYYSLLNAISITTDMTVVRAFKRASAGIHSVGLATSSTFYSRDFYWVNDNSRQVRFYSGATSASSSTSTGSFVSTSIARNGTQLIRLNATEIASGSGATTNTLNALGLTETSRYNSGEISFLAVFPTELTGANLALVEQIAAATNSAVLA